MDSDRYVDKATAWDMLVKSGIQSNEVAAKYLRYLADNSSDPAVKQALQSAANTIEGGAHNGILREQQP